MNNYPPSQTSASHKDHYTPWFDLLKRYADILVKRALGSWRWIAHGDVVLCSIPLAAKAMAVPLQQAIFEAGGHPLIVFSDESVTKHFYTHAQPHQREFFPADWQFGLLNQIDHSLRIIASDDCHLLRDIPPEIIMQRQQALSPYKKEFFAKEHRNQLTWTLALFGTPAMAAEANLTIEEYRDQIINACWLDLADPLEAWDRTVSAVARIKKTLDEMKIERLHMIGEDCDLHIGLGKQRCWLWWSGRNIPSFEVFTSPDWRATQWWMRFNQPMYRFGSLVEGIELHFRDGSITHASATKNESLLTAMIAQPWANKVGEYSLTDRRLSKITKFMAEILYDENIGWTYGNSHIAVGSAYKDAYTWWPLESVTQQEWDDLWFNESVEHTDLISTKNRQVTAYLADWTSRVIYTDGQFTFPIY
jgi:aminopeptidase